jgi:hypothetical protein
MKIEKNTYSPNVEFSENILEISGNLWMEDPACFFELIREEINKKSLKQFKIILSLNHINSSSMKQLFEFLKYIKNKNFKNLKINWNCPDDDIEMGELIKDIGNILELNINVFMVSEKKLFNK